MDTVSQRQRQTTRQNQCCLLPVLCEWWKSCRLAPPRNTPQLQGSQGSSYPACDCTVCHPRSAVKSIRVVKCVLISAPGTTPGMTFSSMSMTCTAAMSTMAPQTALAPSLGTASHRACTKGLCAEFGCSVWMRIVGVVSPLCLLLSLSLFLSL